MQGSLASGPRELQPLPPSSLRRATPCQECGTVDTLARAAGGRGRSRQLAKNERARFENILRRKEMKKQGALCR